MPPEQGTASDPPSDPVSLARAALAAARASTGRTPGPNARPAASSGPASSVGTGSVAKRRPAARPGFPARPTGDDPQPLATAIGGLVEDEGWTLAAATGSVFGRWAQIVGSDLAAHTTPERLADGELTVAADSTAWATQLRLLSGQLVKRLNAEMGDGTVLRVRVVGPVTSTRQPGQWRVRGGRGPRDTYG
ncbi:MAG TPA: DciA family protein [Streptosporangiaceae bacterium]|nr:DciA family protein [Streptosporangiaceae bacterium]